MQVTGSKPPMANWRFRSTWMSKALILQRLVDRVQHCPHTCEGTPYQTWVDATLEDMPVYYADLHAAGAVLVATQPVACPPL